MGLAASIMIYLYVQEDLSYDTMHEKYDRIVRILTIDSAEGVSSKHVGVTQPRLAPAAKEELPEVIESVRFTGGGHYDLSYQDNVLKCEAAFRVDPSVFDVFDFKVIEGPIKGILDNQGPSPLRKRWQKKFSAAKIPLAKPLS